MAYSSGYWPRRPWYGLHDPRYPPPAPQHGPAVPGNGHLRASDADRDRAIDVLKAGFAEGRLRQEEFTERQARVLAARTYAELAALTADLPAGPLGALPGNQAAVPVFLVPRPTNPLAFASLISSFFPLLGSAVAIVCGHAALRQNRATGEGGSGMAAVGLLLGYLTIGVFVVFMVAAVVVSAAAYTSVPPIPPAPPG